MVVRRPTGNTYEGIQMQTLDWVMIGGYFTLLLGVAWWVVYKSKDTAADYFLAGRNLSWWIVGASIFASNIGSEHVVGLAGSGAKDGVAMAHYELHAWCLLMLAWVFVPFYARSMVFTMPEFLEKRFSIGSRYVLSIVSLITFVVSKIAVGIFAGGIVFSTLLPDVHLTLGVHEYRQLLDRLHPRDPADRTVHRSGWHAGRGLQRRHPDGRADLGVGNTDGLWPAAAGRLARIGGRLAQSSRGLRFRHVQSLETAHPQGRGGNLGAGAGQGLGGQCRSRGVVFQRSIPLAGAWRSVPR